MSDIEKDKMRNSCDNMVSITEDKSYLMNRKVFHIKNNFALEKSLENCFPIVKAAKSVKVIRLE